MIKWTNACVMRVSEGSTRERERSTKNIQDHNS